MEIPMGDSCLRTRTIADYLGCFSEEDASVSHKGSLDSDRWQSSWCRSYPSQSHSAMFAVEFSGVWPHLWQDLLVQTKGENTVYSLADCVLIKAD